MLFPPNFFSRQYLSLISRLQSIPDADIYMENHHIYPVSIFGESPELIRVSYKHHIILHYLLWRCYQVEYGDCHYLTYKMANACAFMLSGNRTKRIRLTDAEIAKIVAKKVVASREMPIETRMIMSQSQHNRWNASTQTERELHALHTKEALNRRSAEKKAETRARKSEARHRREEEMTESQKNTRSEKAKARCALIDENQKSETRKRMSLSAKARCERLGIPKIDRQKLLASNLGKKNLHRQLTNGEYETARVAIEEVDRYTNVGWIIGMRPRKSKLR